MNKIKGPLFGGLFFLFFFSCAGIDKESHINYRIFFKRGQYKEAIELLQGSSLAKNKETKLMYLMDLAMGYYQYGDYLKAIGTFQAAKSLSKELYTISLSKKAKSIITNEYADDYRGEDFERSYVHYYLAKAYFHLYQEGKYKQYDSGDIKEVSNSQKNQYLFSARAEMVAWDSFFRNIQQTKKFKTLYFNDIFAKVFAGTIHEAIGQRAEDQIALKMYEDAREMFPLVSPLYRDFNLDADKYGNKFFKWVQKNFKGGESLKYGKKDKSLLEVSNRLKDFIDYKYFKILKKLRRSTFNNLKRRKKIPSRILKRLKQNNKDNVTIALELGLVPLKEEKPIDLNLQAAFNPNYSTSTKLVAVASNIAVRAFAYDVLGLKPRGALVTRRGLDVYDSFNLGGMTNIATAGPALQFKIPKVKNEPQKLKVDIKVIKGTKVYKTIPMSLTAPIGEIARLTNKEQLGGYLLSTGGKFLVKQGLAVLAAYGTYKALNKNGKNGGFAKTMALATYIGATATISYLEKADVRHWTTLPREIHTSSLYLPSGKYTLNAQVKKAGEVVNNFELGKISVSASKPSFFSYRRNQL